MEKGWWNGIVMCQSDQPEWTVPSKDLAQEMLGPELCLQPVSDERAPEAPASPSNREDSIHLWCTHNPGTKLWEDLLDQFAPFFPGAAGTSVAKGASELQKQRCSTCLAAQWLLELTSQDEHLHVSPAQPSYAPSINTEVEGGSSMGATCLTHPPMNCHVDFTTTTLDLVFSVSVTPGLALDSNPSTSFSAPVNDLDLWWFHSLLHALTWLFAPLLTGIWNKPRCWYLDWT